MKINESYTYPNTTVEAIYALATDKAHREEVSVAQHATDYDVTIEGNVVTIVSSIPAEMPDFIQKFIGETVKFKQVETWDEPAADGSRKATLRATVVGQPADVNGDITMAPSGADVVFTFDADAKVSVPFIGKKIEPEIAKAILAMLRIQVAEGTARLS